ncbi:hypothetical protein DFH27DRAFT_285234 [Peziza echinospora]|nr:hypothetical protein DFH27DRAFT_285234 [Peziza echinospora]
MVLFLRGTRGGALYEPMSVLSRSTVRGRGPAEPAADILARRLALLHSIACPACALLCTSGHLSAWLTDCGRTKLHYRRTSRIPQAQREKKAPRTEPPDKGRQSLGRPLRTAISLPSALRCLAALLPGWLWLWTRSLARWLALPSLVALPALIEPSLARSFPRCRPNSTHTRPAPERAGAAKGGPLDNSRRCRHEHPAPTAHRTHHTLFFLQYPPHRSVRRHPAIVDSVSESPAPTLVGGLEYPRRRCSIDGSSSPHKSCPRTKPPGTPPPQLHPFQYYYYLRCSCPTPAALSHPSALLLLVLRRRRRRNSPQSAHRSKHSPSLAHLATWSWRRPFLVTCISRQR